MKKKNKAFTISLLGLLLLVPFMTPTRAQVPSYVGIAAEEEYAYDLNVYTLNWGQWVTDNMSSWLATLFAHDPGSTLTQVWTDTSWDATAPQLVFRSVINGFLPESTTTYTFTGVNLTQYIEVPDFPSANSESSYVWQIGNNASAFAEVGLYGGYATTPYWIPGTTFAPVGINWTDFVAICNFAIGLYWGPYAGNTTFTELANGYSMSVPAYGYINNSLPIEINATYNANGALTYNSFEYGGSLLYDYELSSYELDVVDPGVTAGSSDFSVDHDYTGVTINWTATDGNPNTYSVTDNGAAIGGDTAWTSGVEVQFNVPDGLAAGDHDFVITFKDDGDNTITDTVVMTVGAAPATPPPDIPGYDLPIVLGISSIMSIGLIVLMKKRKK